MCSLARPSALGSFDAAAFLDRRRGCTAVAPAARGVMAREPPARPAGAMPSSAARTQMRGRDGLDGNAAGEASVVPATRGQQRLQERMRAELDAVHAIHRKAVLLCRGGAGRSGAGAATAVKGNARFSAATGPPREAPSEAAAKRRKTSPTTKPAAEAADRIRPVKQQQQPPSQRTPAAPPLPERKIEKAKEVEERRRRKEEEEEEMARAREECRRLVLAMEMAPLPDETVYRHELEELGIAPFEYAVTRTRSQAQSQDMILVGVAYSRIVGNVR